MRKLFLGQAPVILVFADSPSVQALSHEITMRDFCFDLEATVVKIGLLLLALISVCFIGTAGAQQPTPTPMVPLYSFCSPPNCRDSAGNPDGLVPIGGLIQDAAGNLYGSTNGGGANQRGTVFKVDTMGHETVLYNFCSAVNCADGEGPEGDLIQDAAGNLYGTTLEGGVIADSLQGGTVFKVDKIGNLTVLYRFCSAPNCTDGSLPNGHLIQDAAGNLYGTTQAGGLGSGIVFKVDQTGHETVLHSFCSPPSCIDSAGNPDGVQPKSGLIQDAAGNLYGTTAGGNSIVGLGGNQGTVFKVDILGHETVLHSFCLSPSCIDSAGNPDGVSPQGVLIQDAAGNLYGTTAGGGANRQGTVFKVDATGHETVLYNFCSAANCEDGKNPFAGLIRDSRGNLYGTTESGGANQQGTVFKVDTTGHETVLYNFCSAANCADGKSPFAGLIQDATGNLYGTTFGGGANAAADHGLGGGTVFKITAPRACSVNPIDILVHVENHGTTIYASFAPTSATFPGALFAAASACGFQSFNWQQTVTNLPCPSPFFPVSIPSIPAVNLCPTPTHNALTATAGATFLDPPNGGYTYNRPYNPFPFYYPVADVLAPNIASIWDSLTGSFDIPIVDTNGGVLSFSDNPSDPCLPGGNPSFCDPVPGLLDPPGSVLGFTTALVGVQRDGTPSPPLYQWTWTDSFNGTSGGIAALSNPNPVDPGSGTGGITITSINGVPQTPPAISCAATPSVLWPPNGNQVAVGVSGAITPGTSAITAARSVFSIADSEGQVQPGGPITLQSDGTYSLTIDLVASREGKDKNGRQYTIVVAAADNIGNVGSCSTVVTVPHDQGH